ncbi:MAG: polysaccharide biosynthesis protein [Candidatus Aminicenantes bacterium RBG_16_63_16]|nr:MAG: polysaccharide biosynthesis protein [Candidatus Aminicenantes bacterium RBG_16_63_16]
MKEKLPLARPDITDLERERVLEVMRTPNLSLGPRLGEFEEKFAAYVGSKQAVAVNSGTSGLHLCVRALGLKEGDEVITTPFSFIASANCLLFERVKPAFVDIDERFYNVDTNKLESCIRSLRKSARGKKLRGILPVHVFGRPCEMSEILGLAAQYDLPVIEDACEAVGAELLFPAEKSRNIIWKKAGTFGDCGVFAFYPNKQMTTGEGGMIVTDDKKLAALCRSLRNQGRAPGGGWLQHARLGFNYRLSDINCALGIAQLERIGEIIEKRERVARLYDEKLKEIPEIIPPPFEPDKKISWFVYVVRLAGRFRRRDRDFVLAKLRQAGIGCSDYFSPIHLQPFYRREFGFRKGDFPITERISERTIALPFHNNLAPGDIDLVGETLKKILKGMRPRPA